MCLDKKHADALCSIIALGFVDQNMKDKEGNILYIFDNPNDAEEHQDLANLMQTKFGVSIISKLVNAKSAVDGRKIHPFIYALPYGNPGEANRANYDETERKAIRADALVQAIDQEATLNSPSKDGVHVGYRGAYVGGFFDFENDTLSLIGPSSLYVRDRKYVTSLSPEPLVVAKAFKDFSDVTENVKIFLKAIAEEQYTTFGNKTSTVVISPDCTDEYISSGTEDDIKDIKEKNKTIASCHGLVSSMYRYSAIPPEHLNDGVCIEFSLSDGTCKSASCIPCALFAAAQGTPASQVHFGRGDYWNLPKRKIKEKNPEMEENWRKFVIACYANGSELVRRASVLPEETIEMASIREEMTVDIPDMFLDALTFEGSFISKMKNSFSDSKEKEKEVLE